VTVFGKWGMSTGLGIAAEGAVGSVTSAIFNLLKEINHLI